MKLDLYVVRDGKELRCGYTTGSCAAAAAKAAVTMLETGEDVNYIEIDTPANIRLKLGVHNRRRTEDQASCCVIKDAGDDPDVTDGMKIYARVERRKDGQIIIDGGLGIGRIRRKGLFGEIGEAAINPVPRKMIEKEIRTVSPQGYNVLIYAPEGETISRRTFNSNIGIEGGISIIGTTGIVEPMSKEALIKTIYMKVDAIEEKGERDNIILVPGNYGRKLAEDLDMIGEIVEVSNFIGDSISYIYQKGFKSINLIGHIGKFAKLAIGIFNTHSNLADGRREAFVYYLALRQAPIDLINKINASLTAEEALNICIEAGYGEIIRDMERGAEDRIRKYLKDENYPVRVRIYSMERGIIMG